VGCKCAPGGYGFERHKSNRMYDVLKGVGREAIPSTEKGCPMGIVYRCSLFSGGTGKIRPTLIQPISAQ